MEVLQNSIDKIDKVFCKVYMQEKPAYAHYITGETLRIAGMPEEALKEYVKAIFIDKDYANAYKGLGLANKKLGNLKEAIFNLRRSIEKMPFDKQTYNELAICYMDTHQYGEAIKYLKKAIKIDPDYIEATFNLAVVHEMVDENKMALAVYNKIIEKHPSYLSAYNNIASLYLRLNNQRAAINIYKKLLEINIDYTRAYLGLALAYDVLGKTGIAKMFYREYLRKCPNSENRGSIIKRITNMKTTSVAALKLL